MKMLHLRYYFFSAMQGNAVANVLLGLLTLTRYDRSFFYCKLDIMDIITNFNSSYLWYFISWLPLVPFLSWKITTRRPAIILTSYVGIGERGLLRGRSTTYMVWVSVYQTYKKFCKKKATKRVLLKYKLTFYWFL